MKYVLQLGEQKQGRLKNLLPINATLLTYSGGNSEEGVIRHMLVSVGSLLDSYVTLRQTVHFSGTCFYICIMNGLIGQLFPPNRSSPS